MFVNPLPAVYCHKSWHVWHGHSSWPAAHCKDQLLPNMAKQPLATPYKWIALRMFTVSPAPNTRLPMISRLIRGLIGRIACILGTGTHHIIEAAPKYRDGSSLNRPNHLWLAHIALHPSMLQKSNLKELSCPPTYSEHISYFQQKMRSWIRNLKRQFDEITIVKFAQQAFRAKHSVLKAVCVCGSKVWWIYSAHNNAPATHYNIMTTNNYCIIFLIISLAISWQDIEKHDQLG